MQTARRWTRFPLALHRPPRARARRASLPADSGVAPRFGPSRVRASARPRDPRPFRPHIRCCRRRCRGPRCVRCRARRRTSRHESSLRLRGAHRSPRAGRLRFPGSAPRTRSHPGPGASRSSRYRRAMRRVLSRAPRTSERRRGSARSRPARTFRFRRDPHRDACRSAPARLLRGRRSECRAPRETATYSSRARSAHAAPAEVLSSACSRTLRASSECGTMRGRNPDSRCRRRGRR